MTFTVRCTIVQSAVLRLPVVCLSVLLSVCLSVTLVDHDHIGWKSWKLIAWTISPTSSLFVAQRSVIHLLPGEHGEILGRLEIGLALVCSLARHLPRPFVYVAGSYLYCWIIPILHQYCTTKAHRAVIFTIAQLSCIHVIWERFYASLLAITFIFSDNNR